LRVVGALESCLPASTLPLVDRLRLKEMKMLVVDITAADAGERLGRYKVSERRRDGSLVLVPETVEEVIAETADRPLSSDEFLDALDRLGAASFQQTG
jgi:hypothetical protein